MSNAVIICIPSPYYRPTVTHSVPAGGTVVRYHGWDATPALKGPRETVWMRMASLGDGLGCRPDARPPRSHSFLRSPVRGQGRVQKQTSSNWTTACDQL